MKKLALKYLLSTNERETRTRLRSFLASGMTVSDIIAQLTEKYRTSTKSTRPFLGRLIAYTYDFDAPGTARRAADLFGIDTPAGLSVGESVSIYGLDSHETLLWRRMFSKDVTSWQPIVAPFPSEKWNMAVSPRIESDVLTISEEEHIYVLMENDGTLNLFVLDNCHEDILIDEESFGHDIPLYFTESTHFISPVFKVKKAKCILDYILREIGYPSIPISMKVLFTHSNANLLNITDYEDENYICDAWKGVDVLMISDILPDYLFSDARSIIFKSYEPEAPINQLRATLLYSLAATSIIYKSIGNTYFPNLTIDATLKSLCKNNSIFIN